MKYNIASQIPIKLHNEVIICLRKYLSLATNFYDLAFIEPAIKYRNKGTIAGSAHLSKWQIQLHSNMLLENGSSFIDEVIPHELAHLVTFEIYGNVKPHGKEWQNVMQTVFEKTPYRTHKFSVPEISERKLFAYSCQCQKHFLSIIRHNKIGKSKIQYFCKKCKTELKYLESH